MLQTAAQHQYNKSALAVCLLPLHLLVALLICRDKEHSTIIYESPQPDTPLLRLAWNKQDPRYMAALLLDSPKVIILDIRYPTLPVAELSRHQACVNAVAWAPHSSQHICTAGDDSQVGAVQVLHGGCGQHIACLHMPRCR